MAAVTLSQVRKAFGSTEVVHGVDISIDDSEFCVLVGPSGCGKSTLLRMIAGLEEISSGRIEIGGRVVNDVAPKERDIAMVFQNYALYPHMTVSDNMGFSLKLAGRPLQEIRSRVDEAAQILGLREYLERYPRQLSGGQRQRVAMGRAIVRKPQVFLFDEPLSNLDAKLRVQMRTEIKELHQRLRTTSVYVTHDQIEAMTMADKIVVMNMGKVEQIGSPLELYDNPANQFVAGFIGSPAMNFLPGRVNGAGIDIGEGIRVPVPAGATVAAGREVVGGVEGRARADQTPAMAGQAARAADADLGGDDRLAVRLDVPHVGECQRHQVARRQTPEELDLLAGRAVEDRIGDDAMAARVGPRGDRRVTRGRDRGRVRHARLNEGGALASQASELGQISRTPIEVVRAHAVEHDQQHHSRRARAGDQSLALGPPGRARENDAEHSSQRRSHVLLRDRRAEHALADVAGTPEEERDVHVIAPRAAVHERGAAARDEPALLRHQCDLAAAAGIVGPREHLERAIAVGAAGRLRGFLRSGGRWGKTQKDDRQRASESHHHLCRLMHRTPPASCWSTRREASASGGRLARRKVGSSGRIRTEKEPSTPAEAGPLDPDRQPT